MNLVEAVRGHATPKFAESISAVLGITPERIAAAMDAAIPGLIAAIAARAQTPEDAHSLARTLGETDESILTDPPGAVRSQGATLMNRGGDLLGSLVGGASLTALIGAIGRYTGKSPGSIRSVVGLLAPVVLAALKRERAASNLDEAGLARLLTEQRPHIAAALPQGLARYLATAPNVGALGEYVRSMTAAAPPAHAHVGPPRPLLHASPGPEPRAAASAPRRSVPARNGHSRGHAPGGQHHGHGHNHHHRRRPVPAWIWAVPAIGVLGLGWLIMISMGSSGGPSGGSLDASGPSQVVAAAAPVTDATVGREIDDVINAAAIALGGVRDAATADAAAPTIKELGARLDAAKRVFDRLPTEQRREIGSRVSDALGSRMRNAFERVHGAEDTRRRLGPACEDLLRRLQSFRAD